MENSKQKFVSKLYSVRSVFIQVHFKAAEHGHLDLSNYCEHGIREINSLIETVIQCKPSNKRWIGLSEIFELKNNSTPKSD